MTVGWDERRARGPGGWSESSDRHAPPPRPSVNFHDGEGGLNARQLDGHLGGVKAPPEAVWGSMQQRACALAVAAKILVGPPRATCRQSESGINRGGDCRAEEVWWRPASTSTSRLAFPSGCSRSRCGGPRWQLSALEIGEETALISFRLAPRWEAWHTVPRWSVHSACCPFPGVKVSQQGPHPTYSTVPTLELPPPPLTPKCSHHKLKLMRYGVLHTV